MKTDSYGQTEYDYDVNGRLEIYTFSDAMNLVPWDSTIVPILQTTCLRHLLLYVNASASPVFTGYDSAHRWLNGFVPGYKGVSSSDIGKKSKSVKCFC